jgi:metal transporter CNNM
MAGRSDYDNDDDGGDEDDIDYGGDNDKGEDPYHASTLDGASSSTGDESLGELSAIDSVDRRSAMMRGRGGAVTVRRLRVAPIPSWLAATVSLVAIICLGRTIMTRASGDDTLPVVSIEEDSLGIRGTVFSAHTASLDCDYECCLSFVGVISQGDGSDPLGYYDRNRDNEQYGMRLMQSSNSAVDNPCPTDEDTASGGGRGGLPLGLSWFFIVILLAFSFLFSGLTLGLMSLDPSGLEIVMANSDDPRNARAAKAIYPVRRNGNLLLCTLVVGNVLVNAYVSILMADLTSGIVGLISSTILLVIFGEIVPQAICSRFALQVGEKAVPIVKVFMFLLFPITYPLSFILNKALGHEIGISYSTSEMAKLIEMHVQRGQLEGATGAAMTGALRFRDVSVNEVMTPLADTFMLSAGERLGFDVVAKIFRMGYSRIPIYEVSKSNIIGLLFVKDLIFLDPEDEIPVKNFVQIFGRGLHVVWADDHLGDVLKLLKRGSHMALVRDINSGDGNEDPFYEIKGILTLEDIIEVILGDDIIDETDDPADFNDPESVVATSNSALYIDGFLEKSINDMNGHKDSSLAFDWESRLRLLDERLVDEHLRPDEVRAVAAHLKTNYSKAVELISNKQLQSLLSSIPITEVQPASSCTTSGDGDDSSGVPTDSAELIYERGVPANFCTVVLSGKIMVMAGSDKFRSDVSNWGVLASRALTDPAYVPDFSAWVLPNQNGVGGCRCVKLDRKAFYNAVDNSAVERTVRNVEGASPAVSMSSTATKDSSCVPSGNNGSGSMLVPGNVAPARADGIAQTGSLLQPPTRHVLPQPPGDVVHFEHTISNNIQIDEERKDHSRRRQLRKAFSRARKAESPTQYNT